jgi:hypothetical protein
MCLPTPLEQTKETAQNSQQRQEAVSPRPQELLQENERVPTWGYGHHTSTEASPILASGRDVSEAGVPNERTISSHQKLENGTFCNIRQLPFTKGSSTLGKMLKEAMTCMEKLPYHLVMAKKTDGADNRVAQLDQPLAMHYATKQMKVLMKVKSEL